MASQKKRKTSTAKKRTTSRKKAPQKRRKSRAKKRGGAKRDLLIAFVLFWLVVVAGVVYYWNKEMNSTDSANRNIVVKQTPAAEKKKTVTKNEKRNRAQKAEKEKYSSAAMQIRKQREAAMRAYDETDKQMKHEEEATSEPKKTQTQPIVSLAKKSRVHVSSPAKNSTAHPRLVIIIDDVSNPKELREIRSIPLKLTPSLFPPSKFSPKTVQMAKGLRHYMVHFPMQAGNHPQGAMPATLTLGDSRAKMRTRVKALRKWFPGCRYTNNHTGSVFTSDYKALHTVYGLLKEEGFTFLDSRTSPKSKGKRVAKAYGDFYLFRDVFIDNIQASGPIRKQLKIAVKKAKKRGYAIAIGHPHPMTLRTLKSSLDLLADVDVVYLDELMAR